ncbi:MAG: AsmA-like C-terminal region-containing protein, partial [Thiomicrorhabdus sp.]|nr:AsmA-like C-terminal region-containing protein [Thiomicrorhabdus sp.]
EVTGHVVFDNAQLNILNKLQFTKINGRLDFNEKAVSSNKLSFELLGGTGQVALKTNHSAKQAIITGGGEIFAKEHKWFTKAVPWSAKMAIPFKSAKKGGVNLDLKFNLAKAESKLPAPFDRQSFTNKKLRVKTNISDKILNSELELPGLLSANLTWKKQMSGFELSKNQIWLGETIDSIPGSLNQKSFIKGKVESLSLDEWIPIAKQFEFLSPSEQSSTALDWAKSSISISRVKFLSHDYPDLTLAWKSQAGKPLEVTALNKELDASIQFTQADLIEVNVNKFRFYTDDTASEELKEAETVKNNCAIDVTPKPVLPSVHFTGTNIIIDDRKIDSVAFKVKDSAEQLLIEKITGKFGAGAGELTGRYTFDKKLGKSVFNTQLNSQNVASVTEFIKLKKGFTGKSGQVDIMLTWFGGLECFSTRRAAGDIKFNLQDGSIEDIEPGFARLIGLLSIESLVRRLKLDIKDVTNKGMVYDEIKGQANLKDSKLYIQDFTIKAPSASGVITGSVDVTQQTFNLDAKITPKIGATVPTIAALAGTANPLAALAVYTLMKVLPGVNENLVTYKYKVTGPWTSPNIDGNNKQTPKEENSQSDSILELN